MPRRRSRPEPPVGSHPIDSGTAEIVAEGDRSYRLVVNGVPSSPVDLDDPVRLDFGYLRWIAAVVCAHAPANARLRVLHLGAGGCALARHLIAVRPGSHHLAVEVDAALARGVREWFDLPAAPSLRLRVGDARAVTSALTAGTRDVVVRDAFAGAGTPTHLTTVEFTREVRRVLRPGGCYLLNCGELDKVTAAREEAATVGAVFPSLLVVGAPAVLAGRSQGNVVVVGSDAALPRPALQRELMSGEFPAAAWAGERARSYAGEASACRDGSGT